MSSRGSSGKSSGDTGNGPCSRALGATVVSTTASAVDVAATAAASAGLAVDVEVLAVDAAVSERNECSAATFDLMRRSVSWPGNFPYALRSPERGETGAVAEATAPWPGSDIE